MLSCNWIAEFADALVEHGIFAEDRWGVFTNPAGVPYHESLSDLRHFMCQSDALRREILGVIHGAYWDQDQRKQAFESFAWMMALHAFAWEMRGWQFEPDSVEILEWLT